MPAWTVTLKESVVDDLRALGRREGRAVLKAAVARLAADPLAETRRPNPVAHRELRLFEKYRVLFIVERAERRVTIVLAGETRGETLLVRGRRFTPHHESHPPE